ncbi:hypothetical protein EHP00_871 [Ecytonucleospora hepatopenaei]|uniref:Uncharacterized protein n=1 Tax=Ecytonucleospora hepatopenaei TaxID=646526 RepID=A0A1W0E3Y2_9MICR|nr:hypothetical protein EHP00_871 [Ecytonucleospora hepatopenaei]
MDNSNFIPPKIKSIKCTKNYINNNISNNCFKNNNNSNNCINNTISNSTKYKSTYDEIISLFNHSSMYKILIRKLLRCDDIFYKEYANIILDKVLDLYVFNITNIINIKNSIVNIKNIFRVLTKIEPYMDINILTNTYTNYMICMLQTDSEATHKFMFYIKRKYPNILENDIIKDMVKKNIKDKSIIGRII